MVFLPQAPYGPPEKAYGHRPDGTPGYYLDGGGRVALVPWTIGRSYQELGLTTLRDIVVGLVRELLGDDEPLGRTCRACGDDAAAPRRRPGRAPDQPVGRPAQELRAARAHRGGALRLAAPPTAPPPRRSSPAPPARPPATADLVIRLPDLERFEVVLIEPNSGGIRWPTTRLRRPQASAHHQERAGDRSVPRRTRSSTCAAHLRPRNSSIAVRRTTPTIEKALQSADVAVHRRRPRRSLRRRAEPQMGALRPLRAHEVRAARTCSRRD